MYQNLPWLPLSLKSHQHYHFDDHLLVFVFSSLIIFFFTWNPSQCLTFALFHKAERKLYRRLVEKLGISADSAKAAIALWLWMESIGHHDLTCRIFSLDDHLLRAAMGEAQACAIVLQPNSHRPTSNSDLPITAGLVNEPLNLRFFHHNQDVAARGVAHFLHKICDIDVTFNDNFTKLLDNRSSTSTLNPMARPWEPDVGRGSTERRSMFLTFSRGFPLTTEEIMTFFTSYVLRFS